MEAKEKPLNPKTARQFNIEAGIVELIGNTIARKLNKKQGHEAISYLEGYQEGKKAGIKEVVEWIKENDPEVWGDWQNWCVWQDKLKEMGIEE